MINQNLSQSFPRYSDFDPSVPVWCVTPHTGRTIHRFFDTSPFSPSGRYLGLTRLPYEDRLPSPGDSAEIVLVDLAAGEERVVGETRGWDTQLGAQVQWGSTDEQLLFNDLEISSWRPFGVVLNPFSGFRRELEGTVYEVSPDGQWVVSPDLIRTTLIKPGYGIVVPKNCISQNHGASQEDGIFITSLPSGKSRLLASIQDVIVAATPPIDPVEFRNGDFYGFHVKWNPQGDRLMFILRWLPHHPGARMRTLVITMKADGSEVHVAVPASELDKGGHHPNWCPDGETLMMNLRHGRLAHRAVHRNILAELLFRVRRIRKFSKNTMRLIRVQYDGRDLEVMGKRIVGSGHPSLHRNGRYVVTDAYPNEQVSFGDGTVPIRLLDLQAGKSNTLIRINTTPAYSGPANELRVDPHPAWDREFRRLAFNAFVDGTRRVYVADLTNVLGEHQQ
jgi:hypothetical protein